MSVELSLPLLSGETPPSEHRDGPAVRAWLGSMREGAPLETAQAVIARLSALNRGKLSPSVRLELIEAYHDMANSLWRPLEALFVNAAHPLAGVASEAAVAARDLGVELAYGYKRILSEQAGKRLQVGLPQVPMLVVARCQQVLARVLATSYLSYMPVPSSTWRDLHQVFWLARSVGLADRPLNPEDRRLTPRLAYVQILLLALANPYGFLPGQISLALACLGHYAGLAVLSETPPVHRHVNALAVISVDHDLPPLSAKKLEIGGDSPVLYLQTVDLIYALNKHVQQLELGQAWPLAQVSDTISQVQYLSFMQRLLREWGVTPVRQFDREAAVGQASVTSGLVACWRACREQAGAGAGRADGPVSLSRCDLINRTPGGFALSMPVAAPVPLRVGELVCVREGPEAPWIVGVVRWLRNQQPPERVDFGVQSLGRRPEAALVVPEAKQSGAQSIGLLLHGRRSRDPSTLVGAPGVLGAEESVLLRRGARVELIVPTRQLEQTTTFEQFEFATVS